MNKKLFLFFLIISLGIFIVQPAEAAEIIFKSTESHPALASDLSVDFYLDPQDVSINALEAVISFDSKYLTFSRADDNDSIINYWLTRPTLTGDGKVELSGVIPGGFQGVFSSSYKGVRPGKIITLHFKTKNSGLTEIKTAQITLLQNDGTGTKIPVNPAILKLEVSSTTGPLNFSGVDINPPQEFQPLVSQSPLIFNGKWFVVFNAYDKESGINHYEVEESGNSSPQGIWKETDSPYQLADQSRKKYVFIKAVDNAGNEKIETLPPLFAFASAPFSSPAILIFMLLLFFGLFLWHVYREKKIIS